MHLLATLAFAIIFWEAEDPGRWRAFGPDSVAAAIGAVAGLPVCVSCLAAVVNRLGLRRLRRTPDALDAVHAFQHRALLVLRVTTLAWFAGVVFLTSWTAWFNLGAIAPPLQIFGDLVVVSPFAAALVGIWIFTYRLDTALRAGDSVLPGEDAETSEPTWKFRSYLDFHVRHYFLVVAVPMAVILFSANLARGYESTLTEWTHFAWTADVAVGIMAAAVFVVAPVLLRRIWRTRPLESGTIRTRLEALCDRIGLRCRDILVWESDGMMMNAAVMGIAAPVRYVMLSDALLDTMDEEQIEAVFGHEAGHIRRRHIQYFLLFAFVGWVLVAGLMEWMASGALAERAAGHNALWTIEGVGVVVTVAFWGIGFGMLSRCFERQADLFGARCVAPDEGECRRPCSVHLDDGSLAADGDRVCATGAAVFASALDRVAILNGIPHEERSWRHSSIGSRIRFLTSVAGDPGCAVRFEQWNRRVRAVLWVVACIGLAATCWYVLSVEAPAMLRMQVGQI